MIFGGLTNKEIVILQERTAFYFVHAGVIIKRQFDKKNKSVLLTRVLKILANVIIDWHWLSWEYKEKYSFHGLGEWVWIPHKKGGIAQVLPSFEDIGIKKHFDHFPNVAKLLNSKMYLFFGTTMKKNESKENVVVFPDFIEVEQREKSRVEEKEQAYWGRLVGFYSQFEDDLLDALASCRNQDLAFENLWIKFIFWKRYAGFIFDIVIQENGLLAENSINKLMGYFSANDKCIDQLLREIQYIDLMDDYKKIVKEQGDRTTFAGLIPARIESSEIIKKNLENMINCSFILQSLHHLCKQYQAYLKIDKNCMEVNYSEIEKNLNKINESISLDKENNLLDPKKWHTDFSNTNTEKKIANSFIHLINLVFDYFYKVLEMEFRRPSGYYESYFEDYPLPRDHFIQGN